MIILLQLTKKLNLKTYVNEFANVLGTLADDTQLLLTSRSRRIISGMD